MQDYRNLIKSKDELAVLQDVLTDSDYSRALHTQKLAVHWVSLPAGQRSSSPHAESLEEEFAYIIKGRPHVWVNGSIYQLEPGHAVAFPAGTGIAHTFINNTDEPVEMAVLGDRTKPENKCSFPVNPELFETHQKIWWADAPKHEMGPHDGQPGNLEHQRDWRELSFIKHVSEIPRTDSFSYKGDTETFTAGIRLTKHLGLQFLGLWHEKMETGKRASWPHAHKMEEEFVLILKGHAKAWLNGFVHDLKPGDGVFFPPGTHIAHTIFNESGEDVEYLGIGQADDAGPEERIIYPLNETRNQQCLENGYLWQDPPEIKAYGPHNGIPKVENIRIEMDSDLRFFLKEAEDCLYQKEAEYSLLIGVAELLQSSPISGTPTPGFRIYQKDRLMGAALLSAKSLIVTSIPEPLIVPLVGFLKEKHCTPPGVVGPAFTAEAFAKLWSQATATRSQFAMNQKIYKLDQVKTPPTAEGNFAKAEVEHIELVAQWLLEFTNEALPHDPTTIEKMTELAKVKIQKGEIYLWLDSNHKPVAMNLSGRPTKNGVSISGVYTPPSERKKGYASNVVAQTSQAMLDSGKQFCVLYTDASNPTSNQIYQNIGYQEIGQSKHFVFKKS